MNELPNPIPPKADAALGQKMTFLDEFSRKYLDATEVDAIRSLRPGGPLDRLNITLKCKRCDMIKKEPLRWFHLHDFDCPCGGMFDSQPLRNALVQKALEYLQKTRSQEQLVELFVKEDEKYPQE